MSIRTLVTLSCALTVSACDTSVSLETVIRDDAEVIMINPVKDWQDRSGKCIAGERCWSELTTQQIRDELTLNQAQTYVHKVDRSGGLTFLGDGITGSRGRYIVDQTYFSYTNIDCVADDDSAGLKRVGVGVRVRADIRTNSAKINLSGLLPVAIAAQQNLVTGRISAETWGVSSSNRTINSLRSVSGLALDVGAVQKAITAMTVVEALIEDPNSQLSPHSFAIVESEPGSCEPKSTR